MWDPDGHEAAILARKLVLPVAPTSASLQISVDNVYTIFINNYEMSIGPGEFLAVDGDWRSIETYEVTPALLSGVNEIVVLALDAGSFEGLFFELTVELDNVPTSPLVAR